MKKFSLKKICYNVDMKNKIKIFFLTLIIIIVILIVYFFIKPRKITAPTTVDLKALEELETVAEIEKWCKDNGITAKFEYDDEEKSDVEEIIIEYKSSSPDGKELTFEIKSAKFETELPDAQIPEPPSDEGSDS